MWHRSVWYKCITGYIQNIDKEFKDDTCLKVSKTHYFINFINENLILDDGNIYQNKGGVISYSAFHQIPVK